MNVPTNAGEVHHYIVLIKHLLLDIWYCYYEFDATEEGCIKYMKDKDESKFSIIKGRFVRFEYKEKVSEEVKQKAYKKSQGSADHGKQDNEGAL